jgi:hypothetical protein
MQKETEQDVVVTFRRFQFVVYLCKFVIVLISDISLHHDTIFIFLELCSIYCENVNTECNNLTA